MAVVEQISPSLTWRIRQLAMYPQMQIDDMKLAADFEGIHFGLYYQYELTGVVSLFINANTAQFRKMAVLPNYQNHGFGSQLLNYVIAYSLTQNIKALWCNARLSAVNFYKKLGFESDGETFTENGITFIKMSKDLSKNV